VTGRNKSRKSSPQATDNRSKRRGTDHRKANHQTE